MRVVMSESAVNKTLIVKLAYDTTLNTECLYKEQFRIDNILLEK